MACYHPITAYRPVDGGRLVFEANRQDADEIQIGCGTCIGCLQKRSREWAIRCVHEIRMHAHNSFITLTYDDKHLPVNKSLDHRHWQTFAKKLRQAVWRELNKASARQQRARSESKAREKELPSRPLTGSGGTGGSQQQNAFLWDERDIQIRRDRAGKKPPSRTLHIGFYMCGEYGAKEYRPHYHAILFGIDFADKRLHKSNKRGDALYTSATLDRLWGKGFATVGSATSESARYVANYVMDNHQPTGKKQSLQAIERAQAIAGLKKQYNAMSKRPGIGSSYLRKHGEYLTHDWVIVGGKKQTPPRYYDKWMQKNMPIRFEEIQYERLKKAHAQKEHHTPERLQVQEDVHAAAINFYTSRKEIK